MRATSHHRHRRAVSAIAVLVSAGFVAAQPQEEKTVAERTDVAVTTEDSSDSPFSLSVTYSLYSDYVWRGINLSEYGGEGREKPNHQLDVALDVDLGLLFGQDAGTCGTFTAGGWFEWFAAQKKLDPEKGGQNLQEVDYYLSWGYDIEAIATTVSLGYIFYTFPNAKLINTQEWSFGIEHNDAWMWKGLWPDNEDGILNPSFTLYHDVGASGGSAVWMEFGLSHEFELAPNLTATPSWTLGIDRNLYRDIGGDPRSSTTRLANMLWGLDVTYDMTELLHIPDGRGSVALSGFLYFSDALGNAEDSGFIQDEFFGGMSIGWSF